MTWKNQFQYISSSGRTQATARPRPLRSQPEGPPSKAVPWMASLESLSAHLSLCLLPLTSSASWRPPVPCNRNFSDTGPLGHTLGPILPSSAPVSALSPVTKQQSPVYRPVYIWCSVKTNYMPSCFYKAPALASQPLPQPAPAWESRPPR